MNYHNPSFFSQNALIGKVVNAYLEHIFLTFFQDGDNKESESEKSSSEVVLKESEIGHEQPISPPKIKKEMSKLMSTDEKSAALELVADGFQKKSDHLQSKVGD